MDSAGAFDQVVDRLQHEFPAVVRGVVERILLEEHDLLIGLPVGDIVPPVLVEAVRERLTRIVGVAEADDGDLLGPDEAELA